ncbi:hypothetical protein Ndes2526A_g04874 [Nannochloris sp. 'desiccata']
MFRLLQSLALSVLWMHITHALDTTAQLSVKTSGNAASTNTSDEGPPYTVCDADCQRQVKYLEAFILFVITATALTVGVCCMHVIDSPTRFATPKETRTQE